MHPGINAGRAAFTLSRDPRAFAAAVLAVLTLFACGQGDQDSTGPGGGEEADGSIERFLDRILPEGASGTLVAARDRNLVHCKGFGLADREAHVPARCDTVYDVMSMTKQFTAAAILRLEMMGKLRVTDPIGRYVGPVPADKRDITVHQLLTHTSGLVDALGDDYEPLSREDMLSAALESRLRSHPGAEYHYSNVGYSVLAAIIEKVSGMGYEQFLADHVFEPAGMTQTGYVLPDWDPERVAVEYNAQGRPQGRPFDHPWAEDGPYWNLRGNGGLLSTARDMFSWHLALEGDEVLDQRAKRKLFTPYVLEEPGGDTRYAYGWVISQSGGLGRVAWHDGGNSWSFGILTRLLDKGVMVFWVTNRSENKDERWNLSRLGWRLTEGVADRAATPPA
jgi:CubicO group peptidase (beta-lactamase class C family)